MTTQAQAATVRQEIVVEAPVDRAVVDYEAFATGGTSLDDSRGALVLERLIERRLELRLREQLGGIYTLSVTYDVNGAGDRRLDVLFTCAPESASRLADEVVAVLDDLRAHGATADELDILRAQLARRHRDHMDDPDYWITKIILSTQRGADLRDAVDLAPLLDFLDVGRVKALIARELTFDGTVRGLLVRPGTK